MTFAQPRRGWTGLSIAAAYALALCAGLSVPPDVRAEEGTAPDSYKQWVQRTFSESLQRYETHTNDFESAWQYGRATFDLADLTESKNERLRLAESGLAACRRAILLKPREAAGHYYRGMNIGTIANIRRFTALGLIKDMESAFKATLRLDPTFDRGGADRNLGLLYLQAPGWPLSIGDQAAARRHLKQSVVLSPGYPENRLFLAEAYAKWEEWEALRREVKSIEELLPQAEEAFSGVSWERAWEDWRRRLADLRTKLEDVE